jgi:RNA polymerase sigma factor (sigma-70 family)
MKAKTNHSSRSSRRGVLAAMVLGTALSALGPSAAYAQAPPETLRVISDISRYCTVCWRNAHLAPDYWSDCTQEVFARLLERVSVDDWSRVLAQEGDERRELVRAIDAVKKRCQRSRKWTDGRTESLADRNDQHRRWVADEREIVRLAADQLLSSRQQRIMQMSFEGWSVNEIAQELKVPSERISDEKYKAIRKLRQHLVEAETRG